MRSIVLPVADFLEELADALDTREITSRSYHNKSRVIRTTNRVAKNLSAEYAMREEEYVYSSDGVTERQPWPSDFTAIEQILVDDVPTGRVDYESRLWANPLVFWWGIPVAANYLRPGASAVYPVPTSGSVVKLVVRATIPTLRENATSVTSATWTNDSSDPVASAKVTLVSPTLTLGTNVDKGNGIYAPDGRVYTILDIEDSGATIVLSEPYRGSTVTGSSGAATIGGHIPLVSWWQNALVLAVAERLLSTEEEPAANLGTIQALAADALDAAIFRSETSYGERLTR